MINKNIIEYLSGKEKQSFDVAEFSGKYDKLKNYRTTTNAETMMSMGIRIWKNDLTRGVFGDANEHRSFINVTKEKIKKKIARLIAMDIDADLQNNLFRQIEEQDILEDELNYCLDYYDVLPNSNLAVWWKFFCGFGAVKISWDSDLRSQGWETGKPKLRVCDSRDLYISTNIQQDYLGDLDIIMERRTYATDILMNELENGNIVSPEKGKELIGKIKNHIIANNLKNTTQSTNNAEFEKTDVIVCQYKKPYYLEIRNIKDYLSESDYLYEVLEEDLINEVGKDNLILAEDKEDDVALPEGMRASMKDKKRYDSWFEVIFIPDMNLLIKEPVCIGDRTEYVFYSGHKNPDSSYPISEAFDQAESQDLHSVLLTILTINTVKRFKSIATFIPEGIKDFNQFRRDYKNLDADMLIEEEWADKHPGELPMQWLQPPQSGGDLKMLIQQLENWIAEGTASVPVLSGNISPSHSSGAAIAALTNNAQNSSKDDFYPYLLFIRNICELLKEKIAVYRDYVHKYNHLGVIKKVNENPLKTLTLIAPNCFVRVKDATGNEQAKEIEGQMYERLLDKNYVTYEDAIKKMGVENPDEIILHKREQDPIMNMVMDLKENPQLIPVLLQFIEKSKADMEAQRQPDVAPQEQPQE